MVYNNVVRNETYTLGSAVVAARRSALLAVHHLLQPIQGLSTPHRRELLSVALWKWTEASGVPPHAKFNLRYASIGALDLGVPSKINHEHVWTRKWLIDQLLADSRVWAEQELSAFLEEYGVACVVTVDEHARLGGVKNEGWRRYALTGVEVMDLQRRILLDLDNLTAGAAEQAAQSIEDPDLEEEEPVAAPTELDLRDVFAVIEVMAGPRAAILQRLIRSAAIAGGAAAVGRSRNRDKPVGDYVRIHDTVVEEPTPAAAWVHWTGKVSFGLVEDDVPAWLLEAPGVQVGPHATYGVRCSLTDEAGLPATIDLLMLALQKIRSSATHDV